MGGAVGEVAVPALTPVGPWQTPEVRLQETAFRWSFSKYKVWKECHERFVREYLQHIRVPPLSQKPFLQGNIAHELIEHGRLAVLRGDIAAPAIGTWCQDQLTTYFDKHAAKVTDWAPGEVDLARVEAQTVVSAYVALIEENALLDGEVLCEHPLGTYKAPRQLDNGVGLVGYIDWAKFNRADNTAVVLDAKTSRTMQYIDRDQLRFYAIALEEEFGVTVERAGWMMIRHGKTYWYDITPEEKTNLKARLLAASREVAGLDFRYEPNEQLCLPCPHSNICQRYAHWLLDGGIRDVQTEF